MNKIFIYEKIELRFYFLFIYTQRGHMFVLSLSKCLPCFKSLHVIYT